MWIVMFTNAKTGKATAHRGPFATAIEARQYAIANVQSDEAFEIILLIKE